MTVKTVKRIAVRAVLDRMHAHCVTDNKVKIMRSNKRSFQQKLGTLSQRWPLIAQVNVIALTPSGKSMDMRSIAWQYSDNKVAGN